MKDGGPRSESSRPPLPPRSHHYQSPTSPPPPARAQASTPRACRVSRSHTPCPCYPPSHHLTLPTPSNYKSCQGAPLPGRASHRAPARTTLQPLVTAHCHTRPPHTSPTTCALPCRLLGVGVGPRAVADEGQPHQRVLRPEQHPRHCGGGGQAAGGNVTVECEMQAAAWGMANGRRMRR